MALTTGRAQTISDKRNQPNKNKKNKTPNSVEKKINKKCTETYLESPKHQTPLNYANFSSLERLNYFSVHC